MFDVITLGESMALLSTTGVGKMRYEENFKRTLAGAETNVSIGLSRLGKRVGWISALGDDELGKYILNEVRSEGVDVSQVKIDKAHRTGMMFKEFLPGRKTRSYYYRENSAASHMTPAILCEDYIQQAKIVHVTGITMALSQECRDTVSALMDMARKNGVLVSFDPNIRLKLWSKEAAAAAILPMLEKADIVFTGEDESLLLFGGKSKQEYLEEYLRRGAKIVALKNGKQGSIVSNGKETHTVPIYDVPQVVDTVGAGDAYTAGFLFGYLEGRDIKACGEIGSILGGLITQTYDDYRSGPDLEELQMILDKQEEVLR